MRKIKESGGYDTVVMVGYGATGMQARPPGDALVGYGGVAVKFRLGTEVACSLRPYSSLKFWRGSVVGRRIWGDDDRDDERERGVGRKGAFWGSNCFGRIPCPPPMEEDEEERERI